MPDVAVIIVTRNNPVLLSHAIQKYHEHPAGIDCDYHIVDASSDDPRQGSVLSRQDLGTVTVQDNDRVEVNFEAAYRRLPDYQHYFFAHDDNVPIQDGWLKPFVSRMNGHTDVLTPPEYAELPIGRVGAYSHFWRSYDAVMGRRLPCQFLKYCVAEITGQEPPSQFKYAECDRVLVSSKCLEATDGLVTIRKIAKHVPACAKHFDRELRYSDQGMYPKEKYPAGLHWNKLTLLSEFMNSIVPLMQGFRTVGVDSDGYLEQIHGYDTPFANRYIAHYGAPHSLAALAKHFKTNSKLVKAKFNDPAFLIRANRFFTNYYKDRQ